MRRQLLFVFIFTNFIFSQEKFYLKNIDQIKNDDSFRLVSVDNLGELYFLEGNNLRKGENHIFSDSSIGLLSKVDFYNNFMLKLWYSNFNTLVILDNFLNEITRVNFNEISSLFEISDISSANENNVWVFDESVMRIKKFNFFKKMFIDNIETQIDGNLIDMKSNYNYLWVLTEKFFYKINYNGLIIFKIENKSEFNRLGFYKNNVILSNNKELYHFKNEEKLFIKINLEKLFIKDFFVINETLYIYDEDFVNKYLILTN